MIHLFTQLLSLHICYVLGHTFASFGNPPLGVKVRNMQMDFNTGGTWHWIMQ